MVEADRDSYRETDSERVTWGSDVGHQLQPDSLLKKHGEANITMSLSLSSSLLFNLTPSPSLSLSPPLSLCLCVSLPVPLSCVPCVPSPPLSISLPLMCFGVCYPRVLVHCCRHPKAGSGGHLELRNAVCDIISQCYYSRLTSLHCLKLPGVWVLGGGLGKHTRTKTCTHVVKA